MNKHKPLFYFLTVVIFFSSCSKDESESNARQLTAYNQQLLEYFKEVALGFEFGGATEITRRWDHDMKIFVGGQPTPEHLAETNRIINEINELATTEFHIEIVTDTLQSNFYMYLGSAGDYAKIFPSVASAVASNLGMFNVLWDGSNHIIRGHMYVDITRADLAAQKHLIREELTQSLGIGKDSPRYPESIFQQAFSISTTEYAPIDRDIIRLLYHPDMLVGLNESMIDIILRDILLSEQ